MFCCGRMRQTVVSVKRVGHLVHRQPLGLGVVCARRAAACRRSRPTSSSSSSPSRTSGPCCVCALRIALHRKRARDVRVAIARCRFQLDRRDQKRRRRVVLEINRVRCGVEHIHDRRKRARLACTKARIVDPDLVLEEIPAGVTRQSDEHSSVFTRGTAHCSRACSVRERTSIGRSTAPAALCHASVLRYRAAAPDPRSELSFPKCVSVC